jgi:hypothetical protein
MASISLGRIPHDQGVMIALANQSKPPGLICLARGVSLRLKRRAHSGPRLRRFASRLKEFGIVCRLLRASN